jgi:hypothetical protein
VLVTAAHVQEREGAQMSLERLQLIGADLA